MRDLLHGLVKNGKIAVSSIVNNKPLAAWLTETTQQYQPKHLLEMAYIALYGPPPVCEFGNKRQFNTFVKGYRKGCILGNKCRCVDKFRMEGQKQTLKKRYGVTAVSQIPGVVEKRKTTSKERYGVEFFAQLDERRALQKECWAQRTESDKQIINEKRTQTFLKNYGATHHMKIDEQKAKVKKTNRKRYGVDAPLQNKEIKNKYRQTLAAKTQEQKQQARNKTVETLQSKYGVDAASRIQLSLLARELLFDKEKLGKFIDGKTRDQVLEELTISPSTLFKITTAFGISDRFVAPTRSNFERAVCEFLDQNNIKYIINCRTVIAPKEVDIYIPTHKIAIECSGLYWHAEQSAGRDRHYHSLKYTECSKQDIRLVTIFEDCWRDQQDIVKSRLAHLLNLTKSVIYARKCSIRPVDKTEEKTFLKLNHLQGAVGSTIRLGLYYENKLVSLMTFGRSRFSQKHTYELLRFCNAINTKVVGSASRLFKEFIKQYPGTVISYSDNCWSSDSGLYSTLGFGKKSSTVGYFYTDYRHRYNRIKFQKHKIKPLVENADGKTEWQIMQELGYDRIWDCGQTTWIFDSTLNRQ